MEHYSVTAKDTFQYSAGKRVLLEAIMLSEINQRGIPSYYLSHMGNSNYR